MSLIAFLSTSLEVLMPVRFFQVLGSAVPRIVTLAVIRDIYEG